MDNNTLKQILRLFCNSHYQDHTSRLFQELKILKL